VKEYSGTMALDLAKREMTALGKLQSELVGRVSDAAKAGEWSRIASLRSVEGRKDDQYVCILVGELMKAPFLGALGEVNLAELEDEWDSNEFYRALGVPPPKTGAVWVVFEYAGLTSLQLYCQTAEFRRSRLPTKRGFLGNIVAPPPLPKWNDRARYVRHIMKQSLEAVTNLHAAGVSHRSIGRSSLIMGSKTQDKLQSSSPYAIEASQLSMKLSDFGFACLFDLAVYEKEFCQRARTFGLAVIEGKMTREVELFAQAEDLHALGLVFVGLLLTSLAEVDGPQSPIPATDEETIQRLISDIFGKDIEQFREYVQAEDVWGNMVRLLDDFEGWKLLDSLCFAREKVKEGSMVTAEKLLESPFFAKL
jgi:serine/threonine protein kinase